MIVVGEPCAVFNSGCCEPAAEEEKPTISDGQGGSPEGQKKVQRDPKRKAGGGLP